MKQGLYLLIILSVVSGLVGCKKYLDLKPDSSFILPNSLVNLQSLLDNETTMNLNSQSTGEASSDNYYLTDANWASLSSSAQKNMYIWESDITFAEYANHWSRLYDVVTVSNVVLENLEAVTPKLNEQADWNNIKGSALLYRSKSFLTIAGYWAKAYDKNTSDADMGIPLRLKSDFEVSTARSSVKDTYDRIIADLKQSAALLPDLPKHVMRPSKSAAYGLLARTYLYMGLYDSASYYSDKCLAINSSLLDYNTLSSSASFPIPIYNTEVIMHSATPAISVISSSRARVDSVLYLSYSVNDLRKSVFFKNNGDGTFAFKGNYTRSGSFYTGVTTDEMYLTKAECQARTGNSVAAMNTLNSLLIKRWKVGTFIPITASGPQTALGIILAERRKELLFRDLRWMDIKRLNKEGVFQQTIFRKLNGQTYELLPNENRYALPIPTQVIELGGIQQNPR